eukprot:scaffold71885_cov45-Prasinocladus_malaysianus.AAC.1
MRAATTRKPARSGIEKPVGGPMLLCGGLGLDHDALQPGHELLAVVAGEGPVVAEVRGVAVGVVGVPLVLPCGRQHLLAVACHQEVLELLPIALT